jgi:hypothetical protein
MTVFATVVPLGAHADPTSDARKSIQAVYDKQNAAGSRLDASGNLVGHAPDFISIDAKGRHWNLAHEQQTTREMFAAMHSFSGATTIQKIAVTGGIATVRVSEHVATVLTDPNTNKTAHLVYDGTSTDTWKKGGKGWLLTRSKVISEHGTVDGHPAPE